MTVQAPDIFYIESEKYCWYLRADDDLINQTPFHIADGITNIIHENKIEFSNGPNLCTGCYRGHTDRFTIDEKGLWLTEIVLMGIPKDPVKVDGRLPVKEGFSAVYKDLRIKMKKTSATMILHPPKHGGYGNLQNDKRIVVEIHKGKLIDMRPTLKALRMRKVLTDER